MSKASPSLDLEETENRLAAVKGKRGYLLAHHGLLAMTAPQLLEGYDACYTALTLGNRDLKEVDKEFIWLGILAVKEEHLATQHVSKFLDAGGDPDHVALAVRMAAYAQGAAAFEFAGAYWQSRVADMDGRIQYLAGLDSLLEGKIPDARLVHLSMVAIHTSIRHWTQLKWHISELYALGADERHLAESLTYSMFTGSIPNFIEGCDVWRQMISAGEVAASEPFKHWASIDQDGPG